MVRRWISHGVVGLDSSVILWYCDYCQGHELKENDSESQGPCGISWVIATVDVLFLCQIYTEACEYIFLNLSFF